MTELLDEQQRVAKLTKAEQEAAMERFFADRSTTLIGAQRSAETGTARLHSGCKTPKGAFASSSRSQPTALRH